MNDARLPSSDSRHIPVDYRELFRVSPAPMLLLDVDLNIVDMTDAYIATTRADPDTAIGHYVFDVFPQPDDVRQPIEDAMRRCARGETVDVLDVYYPIPDPGSPGTFVDQWWTTHHRPLKDAAGHITHVIQLAQIVTDRVKAERQTELVLEEMRHRMGNMFALVSTIARLSANGQTDVRAFVDTLQGRIQSLSRSQDILVGKDWAGVTMDRLVRHHLAAYSSGRDERVVLKGRPVHVSADQARSLSLALHELFTNAAKYGALSADDGRLEVDWDIDQDGRFSFEWLEHGLKDVVEPIRKGFGTTILMNVFPSQMGARARRDFGGDHFLYALDPLPAEQDAEP
ncbi:MAG: HWE histidine kinase domain-containing protein [Jannaschia sp.]